MTSSKYFVISVDMNLGRVFDLVCALDFDTALSVVKQRFPSCPVGVEAFELSYCGVIHTWKPLF